MNFKLGEERKVNILGDEWTIQVVDKVNRDGAWGNCAIDNKLIKIKHQDHKDDDIRYEAKWTMKQALRHEIVHAYLDTAGLRWNGGETDNWPRNEQAVDWYAQMIPKIAETYRELGIMK